MMSHMCLQKLFCLFIAWGLALGASFNVRAANADEPPLVELSLKQAYQLALERSETVAIQAQVIKEAEGRFYERMSVFMPKVAFVDTEKHQGEGSRSSDTANLTYIPQREFTFTQPLFSGFKEFAMGASKAEKKQRRLQLARAKQLLFTDVADAFYLLKSYQEDMAALEGINKALQDYSAELVRRQKLGRSRNSEVGSAQARLFQNEALTASVRSQLQIARQLMEFLVGQKIASLANEDLVIAEVSSLETYTVKASLRPDVQAAEAAWEAARKNIIIARAGYFPNVDLVANRYVKRVGASSGVNWDATININVPIFDGGEAYGLTKQAKAQAEEARLQYSLTKRQAQLEIENAYTRLIENQNQTSAYKKAVDAAQENYEAQTSDYKNSLVSNLEVLQSLQDLDTIRRSYVAIKAQAQQAYWALKVATGDISDDAF